MNWLLVINPGTEILSLQHLLKCHPTVQANHILIRHGPEPISIANGLGSGRIENLESLLAICLRVKRHFFVGKVRTRRRAAAWVADHPGKIADDQNGLMPEVLELPQLAQH